MAFGRWFGRGLSSAEKKVSRHFVLAVHMQGGSRFVFVLGLIFEIIPDVCREKRAARAQLAETWEGCESGEAVPSHARRGCACSGLRALRRGF